MKLGYTDLDVTTMLEVQSCYNPICLECVEATLMIALNDLREDKHIIQEWNYSRSLESPWNWQIVITSRQVLNWN